MTQQGHMDRPPSSTMTDSQNQLHDLFLAEPRLIGSCYIIVKSPTIGLWFLLSCHKLIQLQPTLSFHCVLLCGLWGCQMALILREHTRLHYALLPLLMECSRSEVYLTQPPVNYTQVKCNWQRRRDRAVLEDTTLSVNFRTHKCFFSFLLSTWL